MSIGLLISSEENDEVLDFSPMATQDTFVRVWLPICHELGLEFIPIFESGMLITEEVSDDVLRELKRLEDAVRHKDGSPNYNNLLERIRTVTSKLLAYKGQKNVKIWIG
jgi:hypothetical protein